MSDKPVAGLVVAALATPLVLLCCLGPTIVGSLVAGTAAWLGGLGVATVTVATVAGGLVVFGLLRWRHSNPGHDARSQ